MFRIDSEHVIDATISGGPARWKNNLIFFFMPVVLALDTRAKYILYKSTQVLGQGFACVQVFI